MSELRKTLTAAAFRPGNVTEHFQLAAIKDRRIQTATFRFPTGIKEAEAWAEAHQDQNLYICLNPLKDDDQGKATLSRIQETRCLLVDFDPAKTDEDPDGLSPQSRAAARSAALTWKPMLDAVVVDSGRGFQLWVTHETGVDRRSLLGAIREWAREFPLVKVDATHNADRLARLPGSTNHRTGRKAKIL